MMKNIKFVLIACLFTPFVFLPLSWSQLLGAQLGKLLLRLNKKRRHIAQCNIAACLPELTLSQQAELLEKVAAETGKWFLEAPYVWFKHPRFLCRKTFVKNPAVLQNAFKQGRGVIIVLPHLGNWELLNFYVPQHYPFGAMYKPIKSATMESIVFSSRSRVGTKMFSADSLGVRQALKHLKQGKVLAVLSDHLPAVKAGVFVPFFNIPALTGKLTHRLARASNSILLTASVLREGNGFSIEFKPIEGMDTDDPVEAAAQLNKAIEHVIRTAPEQYQWVYRRFGKRPEGSRNIYQ
jgi:KDO2-lipid IV(A) lauroyltransferase